MTDREIVQGLIDRDGEVTREFFFVRCRPLFCSIMRFVFSYEVDYDEFVSELYCYLMENDAARLRQFAYRSSVYQWMKVLAIRFFIKKRDHVIEDRSQEPLYEKNRGDVYESESAVAAKMDMERLLERMGNERYQWVIRRLVLEGAEPESVALSLGVTMANLYNIKKRAMAALTRVALSDVKSYGKKR